MDLTPQRPYVLTEDDRRLLRRLRIQVDDTTPRELPPASDDPDRGGVDHPHLGER